MTSIQTAPSVPEVAITGPFGARRIVDPHATAGDALARMPDRRRVPSEDVPHRPASGAAALPSAGMPYPAGRPCGRGETEIAPVPPRAPVHAAACGPTSVGVAAGCDVSAEVGGDPARRAVPGRPPRTGRRVTASVPAVPPLPPRRPPARSS